MSHEALGTAPAAKRCTRCRQDRPLTEFYRQRRVTNREWYAVGSRCKACCRAVQAVRRQAQGSGAGESPAPVSEALVVSVRAAQGGACAVCREVPAAPLVVDWRDGAVRGLVCRGCAQGLAGFRHRVTTLERAVQYLERTEG